jgi:PHD/YefM family antitoxin component YafN of YafNO toxin-antitoxin module
MELAVSNNSQPIVRHISIDKARTALDSIVRRAHKNKEHFILEKNGVPVAGIIDVDELDDHLELHNASLKRQIKAGYKEYRAGKTKTADAFIAELRGRAMGRKKK